MTGDCDNRYLRRDSSAIRCRRSRPRFEGEGAFRDDGRDCVFVDHLLFPLCDEHDDEGVEGGDNAAHLEAVHEEEGDAAF